ncbi:S-layer homology domain-containing protein [Helicovermis profundi]|uniref:SLH domain-containing protein n=1 Tax=Helicovermis profundi TaxID=3065157 RepID=A0AAU9EC09_9FIRM|nr:hypothetical protein HLPR_27130 [Clostridia bacterium S502]
MNFSRKTIFKIIVTFFMISIILMPLYEKEMSYAGTPEGVSIFNVYTDSTGTISDGGIVYIYVKTSSPYMKLFDPNGYEVTQDFGTKARIKLNNGAFADLISIADMDYNSGEESHSYLKFKYTFTSGEDIANLDLDQTEKDIILETGYTIRDIDNAYALMPSSLDPTGSSHMHLKYSEVTPISDELIGSLSASNVTLGSPQVNPTAVYTTGYDNTLGKTLFEGDTLNIYVKLEPDVNLYDSSTTGTPRTNVKNGAKIQLNNNAYAYLTEISSDSIATYLKFEYIVRYGEYITGLNIGSEDIMVSDGYLRTSDGSHTFGVGTLNDGTDILKLGYSEVEKCVDNSNLSPANLNVDTTNSNYKAVSKIYTTTTDSTLSAGSTVDIYVALGTDSVKLYSTINVESTNYYSYVRLKLNNGAYANLVGIQDSSVSYLGQTLPITFLKFQYTVGSSSSENTNQLALENDDMEIASGYSLRKINSSFTYGLKSLNGETIKYSSEMFPSLDSSMQNSSIKIEANNDYYTASRLYTTTTGSAITVDDTVDIYVVAGQSGLNLYNGENISTDYTKAKIVLNNGGEAYLTNIGDKDILDYSGSSYPSKYTVLKFVYTVKDTDNSQKLDIGSYNIEVETGYKLRDNSGGYDLGVNALEGKNLEYYDDDTTYPNSDEILPESNIIISTESLVKPLVLIYTTTTSSAAITVGETIDIYAVSSVAGIGVYDLNENEVSPPYNNEIKILLNNGAYAFLDSIENYSIRDGLTVSLLKFKYTVSSGEEINGLDIGADHVTIGSEYELRDSIKEHNVGSGALNSLKLLYSPSIYYTDELGTLIDANIDILSGTSTSGSSETVYVPPVDVTLPSNLSEEEFTNRVDDAVVDLASKLQNNASDSLLDLSVNLVNNMANSLKTKELVKKDVDNLVKLTTQVQNSIIDRNNRDFRVKYTTSYLDKIGKVVDEIDKTSEDAKELRKTSRKLSEESVKTMGKIYVPYSGEITKGSTFHSVLKEKLDNYKKDVEKVNDSLDKVLGDKVVKPIEPEIVLTLVRDKTTKEIKTSIHKDVIEEIKAAGIKKVGFEQNDVKVSVGTDEMLKADKKFEVKMNYEKKVVGELPKSTEFIGKPIITDVNIYVDNEKKHSFKKPIELTFKLDNLGMNLTKEEKKKYLVVHRLNEKTGEWEPVGGRYDPITDSITTYRFGLSKYTVLKTTKHFSDVDNSWAKDEINEMLGKGILDKKDTFNPDAKVTRAEFTAWIVRAYNLDENGEGKEFKDVDKDSPYYKEIKLAYENGLINGTGDGNFNPDKEMTREEVGTLIASALTKYEGNVKNSSMANDLAKYDDNDNTSDWSKDSLALLDELQIMDNKDGLKPKSDITKEEAVAMLHGIYN